ncbi:MAG: 5-(carboxyamino)imidazole ribonucleotide mutase [Bacteroidia bacterium]
MAKVGIIMGSDSDLEIMNDAAKILEEFKVEYEMTVTSGHRTPERTFEYAKSAHERGLRVIIAAAGGAAHLAGITAGITTLPVIGVPIKLKTLDGLDSLLSTVQMPAGVPVATVAINGAKNAGLLAIQILATHDEKLHKELLAYKEKMKEEVIRKAAAVEQGRRTIGFKH